MANFLTVEDSLSRQVGTAGIFNGQQAPGDSIQEKGGLKKGEKDEKIQEAVDMAVSYTHLTLPTN